MALLLASSQFFKASNFCSWNYIKFCFTISVLVYKLGVVMGLARTEYQDIWKKIILHPFELHILRQSFKRSIIQEKLGIYKIMTPPCDTTFCYPETSPTCNIDQNQERSKSPLSKQSKPTYEVLALTLHAQEFLWFSTPEPSIICIHYSTSVVMSSILTVLWKYHIKKARKLLQGGVMRVNKEIQLTVKQ